LDSGSSNRNTGYARWRGHGAALALAPDNCWLAVGQFDNVEHARGFVDQVLISAFG
jgi:hypothetical protein